MRKKDIKRIFNICAKSSEINIDSEEIKSVVMEKIGMSNKEKFYTTHEEEEAVEPTFVTAPKKSKGITSIKIAAVGTAAAACFCLTALGIGMFGESGTSNTETTEKSALSLLNCRVDEDGKYYIDQMNLLDDYELFRKYFFGTWEGSFRFPFAPEKKRLIIDDTENSFVMTETDIKFTRFYETGAHALAFTTGSSAGAATFWISPDEPETLYTVWGSGTENSWLQSDESGDYSAIPVVYTLKKTNEPLSEPQKDFLSIFKLYEMAKEYGIDPELLINIKYEIGGTTLYHDDWYQLYPMYLVSETDDKIVIRTSVGNVYETEKEPIEVLCTFEKEDGEWKRSVELIDDSKYQIIGAYLDDENNVCIDFDSLPRSEDYDLFRKYFFGVWDSPDGYLPQSLIIDDSENINFAGRGYYGEFYQPSDQVIAFTLHNSAEGYVLWLDMADPDVMYISVYMWKGGETGVFCSISEHALTKSDALPNESDNGFLSIFKLHEMSRDHGIDFDLLTYIDYGFVDGKYFLHNATYDLYPMYLVSETENKIVIRTSVSNFGEDDIKSIDVICTFVKTEGEWNRSVELINDDDDDENETGITLTGKCLSQDQLVNFEPDYERVRTYIDNWYVADFLNSLDDPGFKDLYCKALTLIRLLSTDINFAPSDAVLAQGDERAQLLLDGEGGLYLESGYTIDSFREAYYSVFTKETADIILATHSIFYSYSGELWYRPITAGDDITKVFEEYELTDQTDTVLEFKRISYHVDIGEPLDYDPAKKEEYEKSEVEFRFVKTEDGWRAEKFLNATEGHLLIS